LEFLEIFANHQVAVTGQTPDIAPADGKIYALRDVTGTVESIPLIAASIMSKKIAAGADKIVLDVKTGSGAFMKNTGDAVKLARTMVSIGQMVGRETMAVISSMAEPLGRAVGNSLEVEEAIDVLSGQGGSAELRHLCLTLGGHMLAAAGAAADFEAGYATLGQLLDNRQALAKFREMVAAQGGDAAVAENRALLPQAAVRQTVETSQSGYVQAVDAARIGYAAMLLGAGREYKGQKIDLGAGLLMQCRIGDYLEKGQALATLYTAESARLADAAEHVRQAITIGADAVPRPQLVLGTVDKDGVHLG
jgi:pyrimidine-nucleoside phosphorylase